MDAFASHLLHVLSSMGPGFTTRKISTHEEMSPENVAALKASLSKAGHVSNATVEECHDSYKRAMGGHLGVIMCACCGRKDVPEDWSNKTATERAALHDPNILSFEPHILTPKEFQSFLLPPGLAEIYDLPVPEHVPPSAESAMLYRFYRQIRTVVTTKDGKHYSLNRKAFHFFNASDKTVSIPFSPEPFSVPPSKLIFSTPAAAESRDAYVRATASGLYYT